MGQDGSARQANARLLARSTRLHLWVAESTAMDNIAATRLLLAFEAKVVPVARTLFPADVLTTPVLALYVPGLGADVIAYYRREDVWPGESSPTSNQPGVIFLNADGLAPTGDAMLRVLAHEYSHALFQRLDPNEARWLDEGLAELLALLTVDDRPPFARAYARTPDIPLLSWAGAADVPAAALYGGVQSFVAFLQKQLGADGFRRFVHSPANGAAGLDDRLQPTDRTFEELFVAWLVESARADQFVRSAAHATFPAAGGDTVRPFGLDVIALFNDQNLQFTFVAAPQFDPLPQAPRSGTVWWSGRAAASNPTLTTWLTLPDDGPVSVRLRLWYDLDPDGDCGYIAGSLDGERWQPLTGRWNNEPTADTTGYCSFGPVYTGVSGGGQNGVWLDETLDLSRFAGQRLQLRVETISGQSLERTGLLVDQVQVWQGDELYAEIRPDAWQAAGFSRLPRQIPTRFHLRLLTFGEGPVDVRPIPVSGSNNGAATTFLVPGPQTAGGHALLLITAAPSLPGATLSYQYRIRLSDSAINNERQP